MADGGDADLLQVLGGEPGQDLGVDLVVPEGLLVLPSPSPRSQGPTSTSPALEDQHPVGRGGEADRVAGRGSINGGEAELEAACCGGGAVELAAAVLGGGDGGRDAAVGYREEVVRADGGHHLGGSERPAGGAVEEVPATSTRARSPLSVDEAGPAGGCGSP